ncbi:glycosyl transferase family 1 [Pseudoroseomonas deserti]|uniref:Glycosyl transferase family 1 n=1 Tax=Teichococcus deserti TaxID=1817963 RepID=A0A1V2GVS2_9PROT|nr:glycosyltransferase family 4 protein [Pseudoroseomonas deserti]ONG47283.1 glycosyl transferase family 1 [Pseudoroseomonas deserti]
MSKRLALLVPGPFGSISGGYGYDRRLVEGFRAGGHEIEVVELAGRHPLPDDAAEATARAALEALPEGVRPIVDGLGLPAFAPVLDQLVARGGIGLIHHPTAIEPGFTEAEHATLKARESAIFQRLPRLVATSRLTADRLPLEFGADPARIGVVEPGTDPAPRSLGSGGPGCAILAVGVLTKRKGHDVLMKALARLPDLDWTLTIAGAPRDPVHAEGLKALAQELAIEQRVTFAGEVTAEALEALYARADIFALATHWEGYGMAAAEALARGLPLALTAGGAIADLMPKEAGVMAAPGDVTSLSRAMRRPIYDRALRAEMADAAWAAGQRLPRWTDRAEAFAAEIDKAAE